MTYTSGEWKKDGLSVIVAQRGIICKCPVVSRGGVFDVEANSRLIAAAPALLEALEDLMDFENNALIDDHVPSELIKKAKHAITQAESK